MSSHHTDKFFQLHYQQVAGGRERARQRAAERLESFQQVRAVRKAEVLTDYLCVTGFGMVWFVYMAMASVAYLRYIVGA